MAMFEVHLSDGSTEQIDGADTYGQEGPLTTFFRTDEDRRVIDCWSERLESIRTADIVRIRRAASTAIDDDARAGAGALAEIRGLREAV